MDGTVACLVFKTARCFDQLGDKAVAAWMIANLHGVRGIERMLFFADTRFFSRAKELADGYGYDCYELPWQTSADATRLRQWLRTNRNMTPRSIVLAEPVFPYLPAGKIEACLAHANRTKSTSLLMRVFANVKATLPDFRVHIETETAARPIVEIDIVEALDVRNQNEFRLADALCFRDSQKGKK
jgi:hypothetical protein